MTYLVLTDVHGVSLELRPHLGYLCRKLVMSDLHDIRLDLLGHLLHFGQAENLLLLSLQCVQEVPIFDLESLVCEVPPLYLGSLNVIS